MKNLILLLILLIPSLTLADDRPARKAGLWEIQTSMPGLPIAQKMKQCIDAATDEALMQGGGKMGGKMGAQCTKSEFRRDGDRFISETDCASGGIRMISKTVFSGDFSSNYSGEIVTKFVPPVAGMSERKMKISARWVGPCEAGQKPGDVIMPNGMNMDMGSLKIPGAAN